MAFFTRVNLNVPVLPPNEPSTSSQMTNTNDDLPSPDHRRHASEPIKSTKAHNQANRKLSGPGINDRNSKILSDNETTNSDSQKEGDEEDDEPKRYEYIVDRVLGVEV